MGPSIRVSYVMHPVLDPVLNEALTSWSSYGQHQNSQ